MFNFIKLSFDPFLADEGKTKSIRSNLFVSVNKMHHEDNERTVKQSLKPCGCELISGSENWKNISVNKLEKYLIESMKYFI